MPLTENRYALILSGGGLRATVFHLGLLLRLAAEARLERVSVISTVSGGSLAAGIAFSTAGLAWPSSRSFLDTTLPQAYHLLTNHSLQAEAGVRTLFQPWKIFSSRGDLFARALETLWNIRGTMKN